MRTGTGVVQAFIESECRAAAGMAQQALAALKADKPSEARQCVTKARLCLMAALLHMRDAPAADEAACTDTDRLDDMLREIERLLHRRR